MAKKPIAYLPPHNPISEYAETKRVVTHQVLPTPEETMKQIEELQYMVDLGMKKRPKNK